MRLIDADALLEREAANPFIVMARGSGKGLLNACKTYLNVVVNDAPTIEAEPVKHGRWNYNARHCDLECSLCGEVSRRTNYCPNCGAKMDSVEDIKE